MSFSVYSCPWINTFSLVLVIKITRLYLLLTYVCVKGQLRVWIDWLLNLCCPDPHWCSVSLHHSPQMNPQPQLWVTVVFQGVGVFGWLVVGEGLPTVRVLPVQRCQKHCSSFNLWLTPGDMGNTCRSCFYPQTILMRQNSNFRQYK